MIRIVNVRGMNKPEQRAQVVYCGRKFAGWPQGIFANPFKPGKDADPLGQFRQFLLNMKERYPAEFESMITAVWLLSEEGKKPLGCWCTNATVGDGSPVVCHAQIVGEFLQERFGPK